MDGGHAGRHDARDERPRRGHQPADAAPGRPSTAPGPTGQTGRYLQYRAELATTDTERTPLLRQVTIGYNPTPTRAPDDPDAARRLRGATDVAVGTPVVVQFSEAMDAATITAATFRLRARGATDVTADVSGGGRHGDADAELAPELQHRATR